MQVDICYRLHNGVVARLLTVRWPQGRSLDQARAARVERLISELVGPSYSSRNWCTRVSVQAQKWMQENTFSDWADWAPAAVPPGSPAQLRWRMRRIRRRSCASLTATVWSCRRYAQTPTSARARHRHPGHETGRRLPRYPASRTPGSRWSRTSPGGRSAEVDVRTKRPTAALRARRGNQCSMIGSSRAGVDGRSVDSSSGLAAEAVVRIQSTLGCSGHLPAERSVSVSSTIGGVIFADRRTASCAATQSGNSTSLGTPRVSRPRSARSMARSPANRCSGRKPTNHSAPQMVSLAMPSRGVSGPQVTATSTNPSATARSTSPHHMRRTCSSTPGVAARSAAQRCGTRSEWTPGVTPRRTSPTSPSAHWCMATSVDAASSRITVARLRSSAPALVSCTRRVVRLSNGVPTSRSRRRIKALKPGCPRCNRRAARPK